MNVKNELADHSYTSIDATIIADSYNTVGNKRLTTFIITFPRIVLAEFNTHRMFSRNSASSRAIPFKEMVERCEDTPFVPIKFQKDHSGMQGTEYFEGEQEKQMRDCWLQARHGAVENAKKLHRQNLTKQLCNRGLETYMWHTVIVSATEFENFFALRAHPAAEIHIAALADKMLEQYNLSSPIILQPGEWHIPFSQNIDDKRLIDALYEINQDKLLLTNKTLNQAKMEVAIARCARLSYFNFEGKDDYLADLKLTNRLSKLGHWSPFEHVAKAMSLDEQTTMSLWHREWQEIGVSGNFRGFEQYRKMFENENLKDNRVI
jgi:thymidylate synthase ThyX